MEYQRIVHPFLPVWDRNCRILILGSLPSVRSRQTAFYYGHPRNRFWPLIAMLLQETCPATVEEKIAMLLNHHIALWDTIFSCEILGSDDSSIRNVIPADLSGLVTGSSIVRVFLNGSTAGKYYHKYQEPLLKIPGQVLPSTSPANAAWSMTRLLEAWQPVVSALQET